MESSWKSLQTGFASFTSSAAEAVGKVDLAARSKDLSKWSSHFTQTMRERTGAIEDDDVTELPEDYQDLEKRVDALNNAHKNLINITKVYTYETYDYPTQVSESAYEISKSAGHTISSWAAAATKGTILPQPGVTEKPVQQPKTLAHALSRSALKASTELVESKETGKLAECLKTYAVAEEKIGQLRLEQDEAIVAGFVKPLQSNVNQTGPLTAVMKSRQTVHNARVALDAARAAEKSANPARQERARLEREAAEEAFVNAANEAELQMKTILRNPEPLKSLAAMVKAQQDFHAKAAEVLKGIEAEIDEAATQAEAADRVSRAQ